MKFIVDENLPWRVAAWLSSRGHLAQHVSELGLLGQADSVIWRRALQTGAHIITRDADFLDLAQSRDAVTVVRLLFGNCATAILLTRLDAFWSEIERRLQAGERTIEIG